MLLLQRLLLLLLLLAVVLAFATTLYDRSSWSLTRLPANGRQPATCDRREEPEMQPLPDNSRQAILLASHSCAKGAPQTLPYHMVSHYSSLNKSTANQFKSGSRLTCLFGMLHKEVVWLNLSQVKLSEQPRSRNASIV